MYSLIIVEDEELIREGMKSCLDWPAYGIELAGDAADGKAALEMAHRLRPDIILTDVVMAEMDGIEFVRRLRAEIPDKTIRVVMISGHEDVDYIKTALKLQVVDYLLKPFHTEELEEVLAKVLRDCDEERSVSERISSLERHRDVSRTLMRERFLQEWMDRELDESELTGYLEVLGGGPEGDTGLAPIGPGQAAEETALHMALFGESAPEETLTADTASGYSDTARIYSAAFIEAAGERPDNGSTAVPGEPPLVLFEAGGGALGAVFAASPQEGAAALARRFEDTAARIGVGAAVERPANLRQAFRQARLALLDAPPAGAASAAVLYDAGRAVREEPLLADIAQHESALLEALERSDRDALQPALRGFTVAVRRAGPHALPYLQAFGSMLLVQIGRRFGALLEATGFAGGESALAALHDARSVSELEQRLAGALEELADVIDSRPDQRKVVRAVTEYMQHTFREELTLAQIAAHVHLSPNYLATLYKKETGTTVIDALTQLRLEEAKRLLREEPGLLIASLAERVGYKDGKYFTKLFKREIGLNPSEYRERCR